MEKVATPDARTIEAVAKMLGVPTSKTAKAVFMIAGHEEKTTREEFVFAVIRGDMEVNETKLANAAKADWLRPATEIEIRAIGAEPGYASAIGIRDATVIVDDSVLTTPNLVAGANELGYHLRNTNLERDYRASIVVDIAAAQPGDACSTCGKPLRAERGVEVGNIFKLGGRYSEAVGASFMDEDDTDRPIIMGSYGIGSGRLLACVAEEHHNDRGLIWPLSVAPYTVHLVLLRGRGSDATEVAERLYTNLAANNLDVLFDDRDESPGVKFADADLVGVPLRVTVSARSLSKGGVELKRRDMEALEIVHEADLVERLRAETESMTAKLDASIVEMPFR